MARTTITKETIPHRKELGSPRVLGGADFDRCSFGGGVLAQDDDPEFGLRVRDVGLRKCRITNAVLHGVAFSDVEIHDLSCSRLTPLACVFRHVVLSGRIPGLMLRPAHYSHPPELREAFAAGAARFYQDVDWALDISRASFVDAEFAGVPGHLVRRDPATQFLLHRDRAAAADRAGLSSGARSALRRAADHVFPSLVVVAPTRSKYFGEIVADLESLRSRGLAE